MQCVWGGLRYGETFDDKSDINPCVGLVVIRGLKEVRRERRATLRNLDETFLEVVENPPNAASEGVRARDAECYYLHV